MKRNVLIFLSLFITTILMAQTSSIPQAISYQAVARNDAGKVLSEKEIGIKVEILQGSATGTAVYTETHKTFSTKTGVLNLLIGQGNAVSGAFASIAWASGPYYLQISLDINGGSNYKLASTTQMLSVPYALYAETAGSVINTGGGSRDNSDIPNFIMIPEDGHYEEMSSILAGKTLEMPIDDKAIDLEFYVLYTRGKDLEVTYEIEGLPAEARVESYAPYISSPNGVGFNETLSNFTPGTYPLTFVLKSNTGETKRYPFTLKVIK